MPTSTCAYPFEWQVLMLARRLSALAGPGHHGFVLTLRQDGAPRALHMECPEGQAYWRAFVDALETARIPNLFHDPFDAPAYTWVSWFLVTRPAMERLIGSPFHTGDFRRDPDRARVARDVTEPAESGEFPISWGVMFQASPDALRREGCAPAGI